METLSKEEIALIQLKDALQFYFIGNYVSSITLAGAAEEILARIFDKSMKDLLGWPYKINYTDLNADLIADFIPYPEMQGLDDEQKEQFKKGIKKRFYQEKNDARNQLKHKDEHEYYVECESFKSAAEEYLSGAIYNYKMFKKKDYIPDELFERYCNERGLHIH